MSETRGAMAVGLAFFAAAMMIVVGAFDALQGLAAIFKKDYFVVGADYIWKLDVTAWGWINLILGVLIIIAGIALLGGALWARIVGIVLAVLVAISNFMWLPYYPVGSVVIIAVCILIIWALTAHGRDVAEQ
jgi:hypothetical protein